MSKFISQAFQGDVLHIHDDGQQTRDFTYVDDIVECNLLACNTSVSVGKVYNVGTGSRTTISELANRIISMLGSESDKEFGAPRLGDVRHSLAGLERAQNDLGYSPRVGIEEGLMTTIEWMKGGLQQ